MISLSSLRTSAVVAFLVLTVAPTCAWGADPESDRDGYFLDLDGNWQHFDSTYERYFVPAEGSQRYGVAALEQLGIIAIGTVWYWWRIDVNRLDWDRPSLLDRLTFKAMRFDNNSSLFNHIYHPIAGASYYGLARVNRLSVPESLGYAFASSFIWEFALEWRELVSINDQIFTGLAATAVGEFLFRFSEYLTSRPDGGQWWNVLGRYTFGLPRTVHAWGFGDAPATGLPDDSLGYSSAHSARIYVAPQFVVMTSKGLQEPLVGLVAEAEIVALPGFGRPGRFARFYDEGNFTSAEVALVVDLLDSADTDLRFMAHLFGHYEQDLEADAETSGVRGEAWVAAASTAFRYTDYDHLKRKDRIAAAHLIGPAAAYWSYSGRSRVRLEASAHLDFAAIHSPAFQKHAETADVSGVKSVLQQQNYQFHLGASGRARATWWYGRGHVGARVAAGAYESIEGLDRREEEATADLHGSERVWELGVWAAIPLPIGEFAARIALDRTRRWSTFGDASERRGELRIAFSAGAAF